jgi:TPR repeat protein
VNDAVRLPYPGLRSFRPDEADLFFGRESCVNEMVDRLAATRFLAVLGASGSGKSSLVHTGLLDALEFGLMAMAGPRWAIADMRPAGQPIANLARALLAIAPKDETEAAAETDAETDAETLAERLRGGPRAVAQWCREGNLAPRTNLLLLVDQFEELFRYADYAGREEAEAFVALMLESAAIEGVPIYVVLTMRSEFLGPCALFPNLAERINAGLYLTRRMTRDEMREAIEGPASVCGFAIKPALTNRLLNDLESFSLSQGKGSADQLQLLARRADQLPLMQHVLNRLWIQAQAGAPGAAPGAPVTLDLGDYESLGGMSGALDAHAEEVLNSIPTEQRAVAEPVFRALMSGETIAAAVRIGRSVREMVDIAGNDKRAAVVKIIEAFRDPACNFLMTSREGPLRDDTVIDISHESLIRHWRRLGNWLRLEAKAAADYRYLEERARRWENHEAGLLKMPDLRTPLDWRRREHPNEAWARRYGGDFKLAELFLDKSIARRKATLGTAIGAAGIIFLVVTGLWINRFIQQRQVIMRQQALLARQSEASADYHKGLALEFPSSNGAANAGNGIGAQAGGQAPTKKGDTNQSHASTALVSQPNYPQAMVWYRKAAALGSTEAEFRIGFLFETGRGVARDDKLAADWYRKAAIGGDATAQFNLALDYTHGRGVPQDYVESAHWYLLAANQGNPDAQNNLGLLYEQGRGVAQDYKLAVGWYLKGANQNNATAQRNLGLLYEQGQGVARDYAAAAGWFRKAANLGNASAQNDLGWLYEQGMGVPRDYAAAAIWLRKSANAGNLEAARHLGFIFNQGGNGVKRDDAEAASWYRKAAMRGDSLAQFDLALLYDQGRGVKEDAAEAAKWYRAAAVQGDAAAQRHLGTLYESGRGLPRDYAQAMFWYLRAANAGDADAQNSLGLLYELGTGGVIHDPAQAAGWFRKAADQGNTMAQFNLGLAYANGRGVAQDYAQSAIWYGKAADHGDSDAQNNLGLLYELGRGVKQDYVKAAALFRAAAEKGNARAQSDLGWLYQEGMGVPHDDAQAAAWFRKAADQGNAIAQGNLAWLYEQGRGFNRDYAQAALWYRKAAGQGNVEAARHLGFILERGGYGLTPDLAEGASWYLKAANGGDAAAQNNLGLLYQQGRGVKEDYAAAMIWYSKAAAQGDADAMYNLGNLFESGLGVARDDAQAILWFAKDAAAGDPGGERRIGQILTRQGKYDAALTAYRAAVKEAQAILAKAPNDGEAKSEINLTAGRIGDLSFDYLIQGKFQKALDTVNEAIALAPDKIWLQSNQADALMMLGRIDEARAIYVRNAGKKDDGTGRSWTANVLGDFAAMRQKGYTNPLMTEIEANFRNPAPAPVPTKPAATPAH